MRVEKTLYETKNIKKKRNIIFEIIQLPHRELATPMNDINTTVALALLTPVAYFYVGLIKKRLGYFGEYIKSAPILLSINIGLKFLKKQLFMITSTIIRQKRGMNGITVTIGLKKTQTSSNLEKKKLLE